ncbi:Na+/H+ antiporter [Frondihabitans sp. 762G35]|uniref:Na+/H+ antiporter n=1 Tax=Frondihabitans sp. 762G35 TaxID=1446794 RepID=UPI001C1FCB1B|nr:Na+/H+ antiporter [Frondihabitans sp. 762G35]
MQVLELLVVLGATILVGGWIGEKTRVATPIVLLLLGGALGFVPGLGGVQLPPEIVLLLFLPALLYWESLNTSLREIRANLRSITLLATVLVFATAAVVAVVGHAFGMPWAVAIALGAILAPTDATAVTAVAHDLPRRTMTILHTESLVNDGTALTLFAVAVAAATSGTDVTFGPAALQFVASYGVGIAIGLAVGLAVVFLRRFLHDERLESVFSVLTPFLAYLPAEALGVSGVVAVVTCGLVLSQGGPKVISARGRIQGFGFWEVAVQLLNGSLFVLLGLEFHRVVTDLAGGRLGPAALLAALLVVAVVLTRIFWVNVAPVVIRLLDRRPAQRARRIHWRQRTPIAWAGFRGAVSLAAALSLPAETANGDPFPMRDLIIASTFAVILVTLIVQGSTLPAVIRFADLPPDPTEADEFVLAERSALETALDELDEVARGLETSEKAKEVVRASYRERLERLDRDEENSEADDDAEEEQVDQEERLRLALLGVKRETVVKLRDERRIDDTVLRRYQARLDVEELRLAEVEDDD